MLKVFPQLADARIEFAWGGYVDITMSRAPDFNRLAPNVYYLQGFSGHGIALTGIAGQLVAEAIAGQAERFDVFTKLRHRKFPGGAALQDAGAGARDGVVSAARSDCRLVALAQPRLRTRTRSCRSRERRPSLSSGKRGFVSRQIQRARFSLVGFSRPGISLSS